eukprot:14992113-Alexandrium_andersonii.AAC.1
MSTGSVPAGVKSLLPGGFDGGPTLPAAAPLRDPIDIAKREILRDAGDIITEFFAAHGAFDPTSQYAAELAVCDGQSDGD